MREEPAPPPLLLTRSEAGAASVVNPVVEAGSVTAAASTFFLFELGGVKVGDARMEACAESGGDVDDGDVLSATEEVGSDGSIEGDSGGRNCSRASPPSALPTNCSLLVRRCCLAARFAR